MSKAAKNKFIYVGSSTHTTWYFETPCCHITAEAPGKFQNDWKLLTYECRGTETHDKMAYRFVNKCPGLNGAQFGHLWYF